MSASRIQFNSPWSPGPVQGADRVVGARAGPKAVRTVQEVLLVDGLQHLAQSILDHLVLECRYAQRPRLAIVLRDVDTSDRLVTIALRPQPLVQALEVVPQVLSVVFLRDPIHADRRVLTLAVERPVQGQLIEQMGQRVELSVGFPLGSFRYLPEFR